MSTVRRLLQSANPVADRGRRDLSPRALSPRARDELAALVATAPAAETPAAASPAPRRRVDRLAVAGIAVAVVAVVTVLGLTWLAGGTSVAPSTADEPYYTATELTDAADLIVRGTLLSTREDASRGYPATVAEVSVDLVAKGDVTSGDVIEIAYVTPGTGPVAADGLAAGGEYVLLLVTYPDDPASLVNSTQGYYAVQGGRAVAGPENAVELEADVRAALRVD